MNSERVAQAQQLVKEAGFPEPVGYSKGDTDYVRMCETEDLDLVITAFTRGKWKTREPLPIRGA